MISSLPVTSPRRRRRMLRFITNGWFIITTIGGANTTASSSQAPANPTLSLRQFNSSVGDVAANQDGIYLQCWKGWGESHAEKEEEEEEDTLEDTPLNLHHPRVHKTALSSCQTCSNKKGSRHDSRGDDSIILFHALVWLPWDNFGMDHPTHDTWIAILTSLLLSNRFRLTLFLPAILHETTTTTIAIELQQKLLSGIPCDHPVHHDAGWERRIDIQLVVPSHPHTNLECSHGTGKSLSWLDPCQIQRAPSVMHVLDTYLQGHHHRHDTLPDLVFTDITAVATFWVAEHYQIPTVAVTDSTQLNDLLQSQPTWSPSWQWSWWKRLGRTLRQRWSSLQSTPRFLQLNRMRKVHNLAYYRHASDFFATSIAIISEFGDLSSVLYHDLDTYQDEDDKATTDTLSNPDLPAQQNHWQQFYITGPLLTPCVACPAKAVVDSTSSTAASSSTAQRVRNVWREGVRHAVTSSKHPPPSTPDTPEDSFHPRILVMVPPSYLSPRATQTLLRGLSLAESSLEAYDDCDWDSTTCQKWMRHLDTVWMAPFNHCEAEQHYLPPVLGSHLRVETSSSWSIWDTLDRYHSTHHEDGTSIHKQNGIAVVLLPCRDQRTITLLSSEEWNLSIVCLLLQEDDDDILTHMHNPRVSVLRWVPNSTHSRQVAGTLLQSLRYRQRHRSDHPLSPTSRRKMISKSHHPFENLQNVQSMLERIVTANREHEGPWKNQEEMTSVLRTAVFSSSLDAASKRFAYSQSEFPMYDAWTVFVAWIIVWISIAYLVWHVLILGNASATAAASHHRQYHQFDVASTSSGSTASSSFWTRPDLLDVWILGREWYQRQPDSWWQWVLAGGGSTWDDAVVEPAASARALATNQHHHRPVPALPSPARRKKRR